MQLQHSVAVEMHDDGASLFTKREREHVWIADPWVARILVKVLTDFRNADLR